ncbi:DUF1501 domain-containing protein [Allorhizobium taibaishanense]|uniref:Uncharacterized protein (DUF1501 family) n=1 Tax=Allorhizobium taibaishanense TaxID=887144 RepID=A0A1Q9A0W7_9HYPH|nr:DUF1501 domain-containing protein [Allorhizobium taibaishanense]MBB4007898.1 uncharacterized protein (DUF1501 family) [Allorhizobium taibaishanense]OLP48223.1 hypothetical protein BJF91_08795 [Allorhizobium taibaishanense]
MTDMPLILSRRGFLASACCAAAMPLVTPLAYAEMPGDNRYVAIILRGAMDGLDLVQPYGDPALRIARPELALGADQGLIDLDSFFGLNPVAAPLMPLWKAGELGFVHAVSTPYRNMRSHFDGQDILEAGGMNLGDKDSGWLNRALSLTNTPVKAIDISSAREIILSGPNPADVWSPRADMAMGSDEVGFLVRLYQSDPQFAAVLKEAIGIDQYTDLLYKQQKRGDGVKDAAKMAASLLKERYRIASFSITGWDTHVQQKSNFANAARNLTDAILTLRDELGPDAWRKTAVVAMTEFGRTVRQNANAGTDHGTGGCCIIAGGAIRGGHVYGKWPGLKDENLLDNRDLNPTGDVRAVAAALLSKQFGLSAAALTGTVFPGLSQDDRPQYI